MTLSNIEEAVRKARGNRKEIISTIETSIKECLEKSELPPCAVRVEKNIFIVFIKKCVINIFPLSEIMDVYAFRIVVDSIDTCYRVLGAVHRSL